MEKNEIEYIKIGKRVFFPLEGITSYISQDDMIQNSQLKIIPVEEIINKGQLLSGREIPGENELLKYLYVEEVAHYLHQNSETVSKWIREGKLHAKGFKNCAKLIPISSFIEFIENHRMPRNTDKTQSTVSRENCNKFILNVATTLSLSQDIKDNLSRLLSEIISQSIKEKILEQRWFNEVEFRKRFLKDKTHNYYHQSDDKKYQAHPQNLWIVFGSGRSPN